MGTLLTFSPFLAFTLATWSVGADIGLVVGLVVSFMLLLFNWNRHPEREPGVYDLCVFYLFAVLALYDGFGEPMWSASGVQVRVEAGVLLAILASVVIRKPCTLPAARALLGDAQRADARFVRTNDTLCTAWAAAFAVMISAELLGQFRPGANPLAAQLLTVAAVACAEFFCRRHLQRRHGQGPHGAA